MPRRTLSLSAQQIDPLSWFTGPHLPAVFAVVAALYGGAAVVVSADGGAGTWWQIAAVALVVLSLVVVHIATRPEVRAFEAAAGAAALVIAGLGVILSAIGYVDSTLRLELWWAPFGISLTLGAQAPYLGTRRVVILGSTATVVLTPLSWLILRDDFGVWGPVSAAVIIAFPLLLGTLITGIFSHHVVGRMRELLLRRSQIVVSTDVVRDDEAEQVERMRLARLSARAVPFMEEILASGVVRDSDRALAGQLARRLRDDLVTDSNRSWLETIAAETHIVVIDPDGRADRMPSSQRTALRGLVRAILDTPEIDPASLLVNLRAQSEGVTAVGLSVDAELPEGRRIMHLAPYLLTLQTAADSLVWDESQFLRVSFEFPAGPTP
ncbi:MAG: hypothetical protein ABW040_10870 [Microbacteriaceae bacterium]